MTTVCHSTSHNASRELIRQSLGVRVVFEDELMKMLKN